MQSQKPYFKKQLCIYETSKILSQYFSLYIMQVHKVHLPLPLHLQQVTNQWQPHTAQRLLWVLKTPEAPPARRAITRDKVSSIFLVVLSQYWVQPLKTPYSQSHNSWTLSLSFNNTQTNDIILPNYKMLSTSSKENIFLETMTQDTITLIIKYILHHWATK